MKLSIEHIDNEEDSETNEYSAALVFEKNHKKINQKEDLCDRLKNISQRREWIDTLDITFSRELFYQYSINDDFKREQFFHQQAKSSAESALKLFPKDFQVFRPADYFAEMSKSDKHMEKIRRKIFDVQKSKKKNETARRLREEKKFASKVRISTQEQKIKEKKKLQNSVKKHRSGMKDQLEMVLNNGSPSKNNKRKVSSKRLSRTVRNKKYGFGGQKKRLKMNDKTSFNTF